MIQGTNINKNSGASSAKNYDCRWCRETEETGNTNHSTAIHNVSDEGYVQAAVFFSIIMPGLGQTYNEHYIKGSFLSLLGFALAWAFGAWGFSIRVIGANEALVSA
jgi:hypothetical protein